MFMFSINFRKHYSKYLKQPDNKRRVVTFLLILAYFYIMHKTIGVRPDHFFLSTIVLVFVFFGKEWGRTFLVDWSPFIIFWIAYDMMRVVADSVRGYIFVIEPYQAEEFLFGWMSSSDIPAFYFQKFQLLHDGEFIKVFLDISTTVFYLLHFIAPLLLGWILWHILSERRNYYLFVYTFTVLNLMALITFMIFPVAPPWYVYDYGFGQPPAYTYDSSGALINFDKLFGQNYLETLWNTFNSNYFAAIPSLHAAYPTLIALFIWLRFKGSTWIFVLYPLYVWFSVVYLNYHYIIDLLIGAGYVFVAYFIAKKVVLPHIFDKIVDYDVNTRLLSNNRKSVK